ncbi:Hypothetical predicted protein [Octopus vulgaris]|uniref:Uncharacterized protein n=1 Tax=Octopus vulgaris TaxID=6645 RepID=A0AA36BLZ9_OCTVU|nr:Hypothetical predicted protein [Octopus vulgaris]
MSNCLGNLQLGKACEGEACHRRKVCEVQWSSIPDISDADQMLKVIRYGKCKNVAVKEIFLGFFSLQRKKKGRLTFVITDDEKSQYNYLSHHCSCDMLKTTTKHFLSHFKSARRKRSVDYISMSTYNMVLSRTLQTQSSLFVSCVISLCPMKPLRPLDSDHMRRKHPEKVGKTIKYFERLKTDFENQSTVKPFKKQTKINDGELITSYKIAHTVAEEIQIDESTVIDNKALLMG